MSKEKLKAGRGITLIALVITIIVMLILVAATVTVALNGGLFQSAKKATADTEKARVSESQLSSGRVKIDDVWYNSVEDYAAGVASSDQVVTTYDKADKKDGYLTENAEFKDGEYTAVIPKGFKISEEEGEGGIETGLVIKDANGNEFVWIPVTDDLDESGTADEPMELEAIHEDALAKYDSQEMLNYYYGYTDNTNKTPYYNYGNFKYTEEYKEMVRQVNKYDGFYIGRYETTIDESGNLGSKENQKVLMASDILIAESHQANGSNVGCYRWWGLYAEQKGYHNKVNIEGNKTNVQTAMIYGVLWDKAMEFIEKKQPDYGIDTSHAEWHTASSVAKSGQLTKDLETKDKAVNIWDLESNIYEWTQAGASRSDIRRIRSRILWHS